MQRSKIKNIVAGGNLWRLDVPGSALIDKLPFLLYAYSLNILFWATLFSELANMLQYKQMTPLYFTAVQAGEIHWASNKHNLLSCTFKKYN